MLPASTGNLNAARRGLPSTRGIDLTRFVREPFGAGATLDLEGLAQAARVAVRMLDNVIDFSRFPLEAQRGQALGSRRIGLGITGLADSLIMLGLHYGSRQSREIAASAMRTICHAGYRASIGIAAVKGSFPFLERKAYLQQPFVQALPKDVRDGIATRGLRNSHLTAIAPTGTISLLANNISSGIEPVFDFAYRRRICDRDGGSAQYRLNDYALRHWRMRFGEQAPSGSFVDAHKFSPFDHMENMLL